MNYFWPCNAQNEWVCDATLLILGIPEGLTYYWPFTLAALLLGGALISRAVTRPNRD
jgi:hypothetical protein